MNKKIKVFVVLEMDSDLFNTEKYLNAASPTPFCSFLTTNYKARVCSKVGPSLYFKFTVSSRYGKEGTVRITNGRLPPLLKTSWRKHFRPRSYSEGQPNFKKIDLERAFNRVMDMESENTGKEDPKATFVGCLNFNIWQFSGWNPEHLFKKILVYCCNTCSERRASLISCASLEEDTEEDSKSPTPTRDHLEDKKDKENNAFECCQEDKTEVHDVSA